LEAEMDVREAISRRRAVREFTTEPVEEAALRGLIDAEVQAPSAVNQQPWLFTVVRDREVLARISNEAKAHMLRTSQAALASHHLLHILNDPKFDIFYGVPALIVLRTRRSLVRRGLFARGREPDARGARGRARHVLDWVCARLARNP
jgi:nitroreductase